MGLRRVIIESDAEAIVKSYVDSQDPPSDIAVLIHNCFDLKNQFGYCGFSFTKRDCNRAAHNWAQKALFDGLSGLWMSILSSWNSLLSDI